MGSVAQALVVPVRLPGGAFVGHAAFAHDIAGMGIVGVMAGFNAVKAHFFKEKTQNGLQGFGHDAAVPPVFPDTVADFGGADFIIPMACSLLGISNDIAMQVVGVGFIIGVIQDYREGMHPPVIEPLAAPRRAVC